MSYTPLIVKADFVAIGVVPAGLQDVRLDPLIRRAQETDLYPLLGAAFYTDLVNAPTDPDYVLLLSGDSYINSGETIDFPGLKMALLYWTWALLLPENQNTLTSHGFNQKTNQHSVKVEGPDLAIAINKAKSAAVSYFKKVEDYLNAKPDTFTLWKCTNKRKTGAVRINSISKYD